MSEENRNLNEEEMKKIGDEELDEVNGGAGGSGYFMTVRNCNGSYLALRPQPVWDEYHELERLFPGYQVFTYGATISGTGLNGKPCSYRYVSFNGIWGWADAAFMC